MTSNLKKQIITGALMTTAMALTLSGFFSLVNVGLTMQWPLIWAKYFAMGWPVGFVVSAIVAVPVQKLASRLAGETDV